MADKGAVKISQPKDESLEAFKAWILELTTHITGKKHTESDMTEKEWEQKWQEFWSN